MTVRDPRIWMWSEACEMLERAERMRRQFFQLAPGAAQSPAWEPPIDVFESGKEITILVALPGVEPDQVKVLFDGAALIVAGVRPIPVAAGSGVIHRLEIPHGRFERRIELRLGPLEVRRRELSHGCLLLTLGKPA